MTSDNLQPVLLQFGHKRTIIGGILQIHQLMYGHIQARELLLGRQAGDIRFLVPGIHHIL